MRDSFTFGPSGAGRFSMKFAYHEIQFITITGLATPPLISDIIGWRVAINLTHSGSFECSSPLITKLYTTTVNNYLGITTGGMTVDCPHRERRGYGGDGHTSYQFALQNFGVGAYFGKWMRDFADVQGPDGLVPFTAPTVSGGGGPAWSGFVVTNPWQTYVTYGDKTILEDMYQTMVGLVAFFRKKPGADGLLHPWTTSMWDFLGDWITPHVRPVCTPFGSSPQPCVHAPSICACVFSTLRLCREANRTQRVPRTSFSTRATFGTSLH
jgi:alpha-L-rhamnosidase